MPQNNKGDLSGGMAGRLKILRGRIENLFSRLGLFGRGQFHFLYI